MNFGPVEDVESVKLICEIYLGKPYTGTEREYGLLKMMLIKNKQGSTGVEPALCYVLGLDQNVDKHGFDARHPHTMTLIELKPSAGINSPDATYNDVTTKKIKELEDTPNNKIIYAVHSEGKLVFMAMVDGKLLAEILKEKYLLTEDKNFSQENTSKGVGNRKTRRQTHKISLLSFVKKFGADKVTVLFYKPHNDFQESLVESLKLKEPVDNISNFDKIISSNLNLVSDQKSQSPVFDLKSFHEI